MNFSVPEMLVHLRAVDRLMTSSRPAGSLGQPGCVIGVPDKNSAVGFLFLEMTLQTKRLISLVQHSGIDRAMR